MEALRGILQMQFWAAAKNPSSTNWNICYGWICASVHLFA